MLRWVSLIRGPDVDSDAMILAYYLKNQITKLGVDIREIWYGFPVIRRASWFWILKPGLF
jgi:hypothetical protein